MGLGKFNNNLAKRNKSDNLIWWILGGVIILGMGGFVVYKIVQGKRVEETSSNQKPTGNKDKPGHISPPSTDLPVPSKEEELEKYLLEKRLDLKKYFVFSLRELKTAKENSAGYKNWRWVSRTLNNDLTKLAADYEKKLKEKGSKFNEGRLGKQIIVFLGSSFRSAPEEEWKGEALDQKIANSEYYVIFEKHEDEPHIYFGSEVNESGETHFFWTNLLSIRTKSPTTHIFKTKSEALEFLKSNDPELINKKK